MNESPKTPGPTSPQGEGFEFPMVEVTIYQAGGKYGFFDCKRCGKKADYKFSAGSGWCAHCGATYLYVEGSFSIQLQPGAPEKSAWWMVLEMDWGSGGTE